MKFYDILIENRFILEARIYICELRGIEHNKDMKLELFSEDEAILIKLKFGNIKLEFIERNE